MSIMSTVVTAITDNQYLLDIVMDEHMERYGGMNRYMNSSHLLREHYVSGRNRTDIRTGSP